MDVRSSTPEGAHFDEIHTSANFDANSNKKLLHFGLKRTDEKAVLNISGHSQTVCLFFNSLINQS